MRIHHNALCRSWKTGSKEVNFDKLFLRGFWPQISQILHRAALTPQKSKSMQILTNINALKRKNELIAFYKRNIWIKQCAMLVLPKLAPSFQKISKQSLIHLSCFSIIFYTILPKFTQVELPWALVRSRSLSRSPNCFCRRSCFALQFSQTLADSGKPSSQSWHINSRASNLAN